MNLIDPTQSLSLIAERRSPVSKYVRDTGESICAIKRSAMRLREVARKLCWFTKDSLVKELNDEADEILQQAYILETAIEANEQQQLSDARATVGETLKDLCR